MSAQGARPAIVTGTSDPPSVGARSQGRLRSWAVAYWPIGLITLIGAVLRLSQFGQSLNGDELWTHVASTKHGLSGVMDWVHSDEEITPPLYTILAWLSAKTGDSETLIRLPSLIAGIATIPLIFGLGLRTVGRKAAYVGALLAALSPFLIWHSVEARAYGLAIFLSAASTLAMLVAIERRTVGWWVSYGALVCAAMYTHYTVAYVLLAQLVWVLWRHRGAWRWALGANVAAAVAFLPWLPSLQDDFGAPSQDIIAQFAPLNWDNGRFVTEEFYFGHPYSGVGTAFGWVGELLLFAGLAVAVIGVVMAVVGRREQGTPEEGRSSDGLILVVMLGLAAPVGAAIVSLMGSEMFLPRNLSASWPGYALVAGAILTMGPRKISIVATTLIVAFFAYGAFKSTQPPLQRPQLRSAAAFVEARTDPDDVVLDVQVLGVGRRGHLEPPALTLDVAMSEPRRLVDALEFSDGQRALTAAAGHRLAIVGVSDWVVGVPDALGLSDGELVAEKTYDGLVSTTALIYQIPPRR